MELDGWVPEPRATTTVGGRGEHLEAGQKSTLRKTSKQSVHTHVGPRPPSRLERTARNKCVETAG